ncbi:MAG: AmmeMemoRadiSam system protein B [Candidatus Pacebacteria bacterium]|nr:AmmeMemoRadiSam system protein B [Candidatus Paceibacterota bacterium]
MSSPDTEKSTRKPAVAGTFYPADQKELQQKIQVSLDNAPDSPKKKVAMILVPHAGYDFSADIAALAYKTLIGQKIKRVYLLGNSHFDRFPGVVVDDNEFWETPLGKAEVDREKIQELFAFSPLVRTHSPTHGKDHALEVQLPFLQTVLDSPFTIIPLLFGNNTLYEYESMANILSSMYEDGDLFVISTDLSHYPPFEIAKKIDQETLKLISRKDGEGLKEHAKSALTTKENMLTILCGLPAVECAIVIARELNLEPKVLGYKNSGDVETENKNRVVGYGAISFILGKSRQKKQDEKELLNAEEQAMLLQIAKTSVENFIQNNTISDFGDIMPKLKKPSGAFVTIKRGGQLRGCVGLILPDDRPLWKVVRDMAIASATKDGRFRSVMANELPELSYEVSVLSSPTKIDDWQKIKLGIDGVVLTKGERVGIFLPQVARETLWSKERFLSELCFQKAGLAPDAFKTDPEITLSVFQAQVF